MRVALRTGHVHNDNVSTCNLLTCIKNKHLTFSLTYRHETEVLYVSTGNTVKY